MKKGFILFLFLSFFMFNSISSAKGISYSYASYFFYIDDPKIIDYAEMYFSIRNTEDHSVFINCTFKEVYGLNISVELEWENELFAPNEIKLNHYNITVFDTFTGLYLLEIDVVGYTDESQGNRIVGGGTIVVGVKYYGDKEGYNLQLEITDQAGHPRNSMVIIRYKSYEYSDLMSFTPIYQFNGTQFEGYLPAGYYQVFAKDNETNWVIEESFELTNDTFKNLQLELVRFNFIPMFPEDGDVGVNISILNRIKVLHDVEIYAELYYQNEKVSETNKEYRSEFLQSKDFRLELWFKKFTWQSGEYTITGYIDSAQVNIASKSYIFPYQVKFDPLNYGIALGFALILIILGVQYVKKKKNN